MKTQKPWRSELILRNFQHNFRSSEVSSWCLVAFILWCSRRVGALKEARMKTQKPWRSELILRNFQHNFRSSEVSSWCLVAFILYCSRRVGALKEARMKTGCFHTVLF